MRQSAEHYLYEHLTTRWLFIRILLFQSHSSFWIDLITCPYTALASIHLFHLDQHSVIMVAARSTPNKAAKASKGSKTTPRTANKSPSGVTKPRKAPKVTSKTRRTREGRFVPATPSPGTISPQEIPEIDLDAPKEVRPPVDQLKRLLAQWECGKNTGAKSRRVRDDHSPPPRPRCRNIES